MSSCPNDSIDLKALTEEVALQVKQRAKKQLRQLALDLCGNEDLDGKIAMALRINKPQLVGEALKELADNLLAVAKEGDRL